MTSFDVQESSLESSRPIEVYRIALGGTTYRYSTSEDAITLASETYEPTAIGRDAIAQGQEERRQPLEITLPGTNEFVRQYVDAPPGQKASVTIIRLQRDETPTFATQTLIYKGAVRSVQFPDAGDTAKVIVQSIEAASSRTIPRHTFMGQCNHMLYDPGCGVDPDLFNHIGVVTDVTGSTITVAGAAASGFNFKAGWCKPTTASDFRLVLAQSGDVLTLLLPFSIDVTGLDMQVFAGCDHNVGGDCALVFDNVAENGSYSFVPKKDIFRTGLD